MIIAAAIKYQGTIYTLSRPARHVDIFAMMVQEKDRQENDRLTFQSGEKGFLIDTGEFLNREAAGRHAITCGQVERVLGGELYTEMLWRDDDSDR